MARVILKESDFINLAIYKNESWKCNFGDKELFEVANGNYENYLETLKGSTEWVEDLTYLRNELKLDILYEIIGTPAYKWHERMINGLTF